MRVLRTARTGERTGTPTALAVQRPATGSHFGALHELEVLASATTFFGWIVGMFAGAIGPRTLEVGAGLGTVSRALVERYPTSLLALEPAANVFPRLVERVGTDPRIRPRQATSSDLLAEYAGDPQQRFDSAVYVNVLEHIEHDLTELRTAHQLLAPEGTLCIVVPAMPFLYSRLDKLSGHYRRYTKETLRRVVEQSGFGIERIEYFDVVGVLPYWLTYRVLGVTTISGRANTLFDRVLVPISRLAQRALVHPPFGKNLVVVARRLP